MSPIHSPQPVPLAPKVTAFNIVLTGEMEHIPIGLVQRVHLISGRMLALIQSKLRRGVQLTPVLFLTGLQERR